MRVDLGHIISPLFRVQIGLIEGEFSVLAGGSHICEGVSVETALYLSCEIVQGHLVKGLVVLLKVHKNTILAGGVIEKDSHHLRLGRLLQR